MRLTGEPIWSQNLRLVMDRHGLTEGGFYTFSYFAVCGAEGRVEGVLTIAAETTTQVLLNRRLALLSTLDEQLAGLDDSDELAEGQVVGRAVPTASRSEVRRQVVRVILGSATALGWARPSRS